MAIKRIIINFTAVICGLFLILKASNISSAEAPPELASNTFEQPAGIEMGIYVADILSGAVLADSRADEPFVPASVMKSITAATVVSLYDPYTRFSTKVSVKGAVGDDGVLEGNLIIRATGDPTLESARFGDYSGICDSIASGLRKAGVDSIVGIIKIEYSMADCGFPDGWLQTDRRFRYGAGHFPINWRDNAFSLSLPDRKTLPEIPGLDVKFVRKKKGGLKFNYNVDNKTLEAVGRIPAKGATSSFGMPNPEEAMCFEITEGLKSQGIGIGLRPLNDIADETTLIYDHHSPTLDEILKEMMYWSDNLIAEAMLRIVAPTESRDTAAERELSFWRLKGADTDNVEIIDGSGLSRNDRLTPLFIADVLQSMALSPRGMTYARLFPIAGKSGTVRNLFSGTDLAGTLALKSGTMSGVRCVAGYKLDEEGYPTHVVVVLTNSGKVSTTQLNKAIESALLKIFD